MLPAIERITTTKLPSSKKIRQRDISGNLYSAETAEP